MCLPVEAASQAGHMQLVRLEVVPGARKEAKSEQPHYIHFIRPY
jgi:hypothetical protein